MAAESEKTLKKVGDSYYQCLVISLSCVTCLTLTVVTFLSNYSAAPGDPLNLGLFRSNDVWNMIPVQSGITPASFTLWIVWPTIFLFQWAWLIYLLTSLCRRNQFGPVFVNPSVVSPFFLWVYCIGAVLVTAWIFVYDRGTLVGALVTFVLTDVFLLMAVISIHRSVCKFGLELQQFHRRDLWAIRIVFLNGTMLFLTWAVVGTLLTLSYVLISVADAPNNTVTVILLAVIGIIMSVYFVLETFFWDKFLRYTYTFWSTIFWGLLGIFVANFGLNRNAMVTLFLLVIAGVLGLSKVALSIWRSKSKPLYAIESDESD